MSIEDIKNKKLEQLRAQIQSQQGQVAQAQQQFAQIEAIVKQNLTKEAFERYGNIKAAHPETAYQLVLVIAQATHGGQLKQKIDDKTLKTILSQLNQKRDIKITRR